MNKTQTRRMSKMMEEKNRELRSDFVAERSGINQPLQQLFDQCISFISVSDFEM